ncbi:hypothetical protein EVAR_18928_1 [Eumeta japonica]|uniref:Uncharacterized protein n=1 Tax=Eumeta variegata TaxID=151549 RepID=A0A4C1V3H6_EUMVA|nr:hypothetical protein EVAR_18928_1 [Eumeta japonica]
MQQCASTLPKESSHRLTVSGAAPAQPTATRASRGHAFTAYTRQQPKPDGLILLITRLRLFVVPRQSGGRTFFSQGRRRAQKTTQHIHRASIQPGMDANKYRLSQLFLFLSPNAADDRSRRDRPQ